MTCTHCSTILRITQQGVQEYRDSIPQRQPPSGVVVERKASGNLSINVPRTWHLYILPKRLTFLALLIGLGLGILITSLWLLVVILSATSGGTHTANLDCAILPPMFVVFASVVVTYSVMVGLRKNLPALRLENGIIYALPTEQTVDGKDVRQIYTAVTIFRDPSDSRLLPLVGVYVLTKDDKRIRLLGPLISEEVALYVEEILEMELGIFNLPVYGDQAIPGQPRDVIPESPTPPASVEGIQCEGCAAQLHETPKDRRHGYVVCKYCNGVTLIYDPGTSKPILGLPKLNSPIFHYRLTKTHTGLEISAHDANTPTRLEISGGALHLYREQRQTHTMVITDIASIHVKKRTIYPDPEQITSGMSVRWLWKSVKAKSEAEKSSGILDPQAVMEQMGDFTTFTIVARNTCGDEIGLLEKIQDPREAFVLVKLLNKIRSQINRRANA